VGWIGGTISLVRLTNLGTITAERLALPEAATNRYGQLGGYGAILAAIGTGAVAAAIMVSRTPSPGEPGRTAYTGVLLLGLATATFGLVHGTVAAVVVGLGFGFGQQLAELRWTTGLQHNVPERLLGRISAVDYLGSFLFLPASFAFGGLLVASVGAELVLLAAGAVGILAAAIGLAVPGLHRWRPFGDDVATELEAGLVGQHSTELTRVPHSRCTKWDHEDRQEETGDGQDQELHP